MAGPRRHVSQIVLDLVRRSTGADEVLPVRGRTQPDAPVYVTRLRLRRG